MRNSVMSFLDDLKRKVMASDVGQRMAKGTFWVFVGTVSSKLLAMVAGIVLARWILDKEAYGQFGVVKSTINMFMVVGSAGLGLTATKYIAEFKAVNKERIPSIYMLTMAFSLGLALLIGFLAFLFSDILSIEALDTPQLIPALKVAAIALMFFIYNYAQEGALSGFEDFRSKAINNFAMHVVQIVAMIAGGYLGLKHWGDGVTGAVIGYSISFVVYVLLDQFSINSNMRKLGLHSSFKSIEKEDVKLLFSFTLPAAISSVLAVPAFWVVRVMLKNYTGGFSDVADYEVADQWRTMVFFLPAMLCQVILPILSSVKREDNAGFWKILNVNLVINVSAALLTALAVVCLSRVILSFYGEQYTNVWPIIYLAIACVFNAVSNLLGIAITSIAHMWQWCGFNVFWAVVMVALSYLFLNKGMGATGVALAVMISYLIHAVGQYIYLKIVK